MSRLMLCMQFTWMLWKWSRCEKQPTLPPSQLHFNPGYLP